MKKYIPSHEELEAQQMAYLIAAYMRNELTPEEKIKLKNWVYESPANEYLFVELTKKHHKGAAWRQLLEKVDEQKEADTKAYWYYLSVGFMILVVFFVYRYDHPLPDDDSSVTVFQKIPSSSRFLRDNVMLSAENGETIDLILTDKNSLNASLNNEIADLDKESITYKIGLPASSAWHTVSVPAKEKYRVTLSDKTVVWLNAGSSLKYQVSFNNNERLVELNGEAYFEIASDSQRPFIVRTPDDHRVKAIGTRFNITAYKDDIRQTITLLQGKILINDRERIVSGQQLVIRDREADQVAEADTAAIISWKNGLFQFNNASITTIMDQVSRWHDIEIVYEDEITDLFNITVPRTTSLSKLLNYLELTGRIRFKQRYDKIIVMKPS